MSISTDQTDVARRTSLNELCEAWTTTAQQIRTAFGQLVEAQNRIVLFFDNSRSSFDVCGSRERPDFKEPEAAIEHLQRQVWGALVDRLELRKILSLKRIAELDNQISTGKGLPPITYANLLDILESNMANAGQYLEEKVFECYEWLRPCGWSLTKYKTNQKSVAAGVGGKVILQWAVQGNYSTHGFEIVYSRVDNLRALDQVFHLLDGAQYAGASYRGPLCDAVQQQTSGQKNDFETPFFRGKCFRNQNLHLEFKRSDLVDKFNLIAGGARLKQPAQAAA